MSDFVHMPSALTVSLIDLCEDLSFMTLKCLRKKNKFMSAVMVRAGKHRKHTPNLYAHTDIMVVRVFVNQICLARHISPRRERLGGGVLAPLSKGATAQEGKLSEKPSEKVVREAGLAHIRRLCQAPSSP